MPPRTTGMSVPPARPSSIEGCPPVAPACAGVSATATRPKLAPTAATSGAEVSRSGCTLGPAARRPEERALSERLAGPAVAACELPHDARELHTIAPAPVGWAGPSLGNTTRGAATGGHPGSVAGAAQPPEPPKPPATLARATGGVPQ